MRASVPVYQKEGNSMADYPDWDGSSSGRLDPTTYRAPDGTDWLRVITELNNTRTMCSNLLRQLADIQEQFQALRSRILAVDVEGASPLQLAQSVTYLKQLIHSASSTLILTSKVTINKDVRLIASSLLGLVSIARNLLWSKHLSSAMVFKSTATVVKN